MGHQPNILDGPQTKYYRSEVLVREEQNELGNWRKARGRDNQPWTGIALSGGGIRSATFCLGVLQALANKDRLKHFDYISTVSGGGYTGCSLQWWWCRQHRPISGPKNKPDAFGWSRTRARYRQKQLSVWHQRTWSDG